MEKTTSVNLIRSKQKYGIISQNIMRNPYISVSAKALYSYLSGFAGAENTAFPRRELICYEMGWTKDTFLKYMWELRCWNIVEVTQERSAAGQFKNNVYIIDHYPPKVMMDRKEFEESVWTELETLIKSKSKAKMPDKSTSVPCPKLSDTVEKKSPCPKKPDPVFSDTNNNSINNNNIYYIDNINNMDSINNKNNNNNNIDNLLDKRTGNIQNDAVVVEHSSNHNTDAAVIGLDLTPKPSFVSRQAIQLEFEKNGIRGLSDKTVNILQTYNFQDIQTVAKTLKEKKETNKIKNPSGLLAACPEIIDAILRDEFFPEITKKGRKTKSIHIDSGQNYTTYIPPGYR